MPRTRIPTRLALALVVVAVALVVVVVAGVLLGSDDEKPSNRTDAISAASTLSPRIVLFGDTLTAAVDVVVDRSVIDPDTVDVTWSDESWKPVGAPEHSRRDSGSTTFLRQTYVLRCLASTCLPLRETEQVQFDPARVAYVGPVGSGTRRLTVAAPWPLLVVHTRIAGTDERRDVLASPWRADTLTLPAVSFRVSPGLLLVFLVVAGVSFLAAAAIVVYRVLPERIPEPEPEPEPEPVASPLEQALALLEAPAASNGAQDRRRALELVAEEVERWGDEDLASTARTLAWSEHDPEGDDTRALAARLRSQLERTNGTPA